jgi:metal-responsive CopG/Arc/MetJ family transcriptional regulator
MTEVITCSLSTELREKVDILRGDVARSKFISRILEDAIRIKQKDVNGEKRT